MARPDLGASLRGAIRRLRPLFLAIRADFQSFDRFHGFTESVLRDLGHLSAPLVLDEALQRLAPFGAALARQAPALAVRLDDTLRIGYRLGAEESLALLQESGRFRLSNVGVLTALSRRAAQSAVQVLDTLQRLIAQVTGSAARQGVTQPAAVDTRLWGQRVLQGQVPLVAEAELGSALQAGLAEQQRRSGVEAKRWQHAYLRGPAEPRPHHLALNGTTIPQTELFTVAWPVFTYRTPGPRDFLQTPLPEVFNCTCAALPVGELTQAPWLGE